MEQNNFLKHGQTSQPRRYTNLSFVKGNTQSNAEQGYLHDCSPIRSLALGHAYICNCFSVSFSILLPIGTLIHFSRFFLWQCIIKVMVHHNLCLWNFSAAADCWRVAHQRRAHWLEGFHTCGSPSMAKANPTTTA